MTLLATTCIAFAIIRFVEEFGRFLLYFFLKKSEKREIRAVSTPDYKRIVVNVTPAVYEAIKNHAERQGLTVTQYGTKALITQLEIDKGTQCGE